MDCELQKVEKHYIRNSLRFAKMDQLTLAFSMIPMVTKDMCWQMWLTMERMESAWRPNVISTTFKSSIILHNTITLALIMD